MRFYRTYALSLALCGLVLFHGCSDQPEQPRTGIVAALVSDSSVGPVADVEITLVPTNHILRTDGEGRAVFEVPPGDYFIDANVCCVGPGFIHYHLPVTVREGETVEVELKACLSCL